MADSLARKQKVSCDMYLLFGRSTGPISIQPLLSYADLVCETNRCYWDFDGDISDTGSDEGKPQMGRGETRLMQKGCESRSNPSIRLDPSKQGLSKPPPRKPPPRKPPPSKPEPGKPKLEGMSGSGICNLNGDRLGSTAPDNKEGSTKDQALPTEGKTPDVMAGLSKEKRAGLVEVRMAASQKAAMWGKLKAEGKKTGAKSKAEAEGKEPKWKGKVNVERKMPEAEAGGKVEEEQEPKGEVEQSKAESQKPKRKVEEKKPKPQTETRKPKVKAKVEVFHTLRDWKLYI